MTEQSSSKNRRILVIDDNEAIHHDFRKILAGAADTTDLEGLKAALLGTSRKPRAALQYDVDSAYQGQEGAAKIRQASQDGRPYSLAFVDMRMPPGWDGLQTIEQLWRDDPHVQVVICTAYSDSSWEDMLERFGQVDRLLILKKPFDYAEISQLAAALTEKWQLARQARARNDELERMVAEQTRQLRAANELLQQEVSQRAAAEERARHDAFHDPLTGLPNRALLMDRLGQCIERGRRQATYALGLLFMDIDNFKLINDSLGHGAGDELLVEIASRMVAGLRSPDTVGRAGEETTARLGGDEFVVLLDGVRRPSDAVAVAERIQRLLAPPFKLGEHEVSISASIGIAVSQGTGQPAEELIRAADTAMYRAKHAGKARYAVFDKTMHAEAMARLELENALRAALDQGEFQLVYQPIVDLANGKINGFEALLRWRHPDRGVVSPAEFIPMAEETGLIVRLGRWVLGEACRQLRAWDETLSSAEPLSMSVNVSGRQLEELGFCKEVEQILRDTGVEARRFNLEITESVVIRASEQTRQTLQQLKQMGVRLHMDDFGTGYSSLSCLHRFPFDALKIDREFIKDLHRHRDYTAIVHAIITLARNLNMRVTAEGLETEEQLVQILALDCDYAQGFMFSKPVDAAAALALALAPPAWLEPKPRRPAALAAATA